jgi:hypothetical protein
VSSAIPGIIAQITEDMDAIEVVIDDHICALDRLDEQYRKDQEPHEHELKRLRAQLRDMECTRRTLEEYAGGFFDKK